ncbi:MAG: choice-of-anchor V domain-containing protein [Bacteroidia bacterium]
MKFNTNSIKYALLVGASLVFMSNRGGSPGGKSGSPSDGSTCSTNGGCHSGGAPVEQKFLSSDIEVGGYVPGKTYTISLNPTKSGISVWGFEMSAEDKNGATIGEFANSDNVNLVSSQNRVTHKFASSSGAGGVTWDATWTAPEAGSGEVKFYAAVLGANGNGKTGGDQVYTDVLTISEGEPSIVSNLESVKIKVYPNPTSEKLFIESTVGARAEIFIFDSKGTLAYSSKNLEPVNVKSWNNGNYYIKVVQGKESITKTFVKL